MIRFLAVIKVHIRRYNFIICTKHLTNLHITSKTIYKIFITLNAFIMMLFIASHAKKSEFAFIIITLAIRKILTFIEVLLITKIEAKLRGRNNLGILLTKKSKTSLKL